MRLTVSVGAARAGAGPTRSTRWIESADRCLYDAKRRGRNRVCLAGDVRAHRRRGRETPSASTLARAHRPRAGAREGDAARPTPSRSPSLAASPPSASACPPGVVMRCRLGGWLHDVGKAAIPHAILDKPGPLDDRTSGRVMRTHPALGEAIVRGVAALRETAAGRAPPPRALRRHRLSRTASPASDIPIEARIVAAADAYCAMTAERVYSAAQTPQEAAVGAAPQRRHAPRSRGRAALLEVTGHAAPLLRSCLTALGRAPTRRARTPCLSTLQLTPAQPDAG